MLRTIPYVTLWVRNFDETLRFYRDVLGLPVEHHDGAFVQFATEGTRLYLHGMSGDTPLRDHTIEIHFSVPDVDAAYETLRARGARFEGPPANMPWGTRQASLRDPEGYAVELVGPLKPGEPAPEQ